MSGNAKAQLFIVISAWVSYTALVLTGKANIEGYVVITTYIVKKFLDLHELQTKGDSNGSDKLDKGDILKSDSSVPGTSSSSPAGS